MNHERTLFAAAVLMRLNTLTRELDALERDARAQAGSAELTGMELASPQIERPDQDAEHEWMQQLDRDIAAAIARADEATERWSERELAKFRNPTERFLGCVQNIRRTARRLKRAAAIGVLGMTIFTPAPITDEPQADQAPFHEETRESPAPTGPRIAMPQITMDVGWLHDLPKPGRTNVSSWPDGDLYLTRMDNGSPVLDELDEMRRETAQAVMHTVATLPPGLVEAMAEESKQSLGSSELSLHMLIQRLDDAQSHGDPRADQFLDAMTALTERLSEIQEAHEEALDPLMEVFGPAKALTEAGLKPDLGLDSPAGKRALADFTEAMANIGVEVEYKSGW